MDIRIHRVYDKLPDTEGYGILVDRLWPRGISKSSTPWDFWEKEIAPSDVLRRWFNHIPERFDEFKSRYFKELDNNPQTPGFLSFVKEKLEKQNVIFFFSARDQEHNQAVVLREYTVERLYLS